MKNQNSWNLPIKLFHWSLVLSIMICWGCYELGEMEIHSWAGYGIIGLVVFRLAWGIWGPQESRISSLFFHPREYIAYLKGKKSYSGHNPFGALSVIALLGIISLQGISGLFNSDEILFDGPYYSAVSSELQDWMGAIHDWNFDVLTALICLHLGAVIYYQFVVKDSLIQKMSLTTLMSSESESCENNLENSRENSLIVKAIASLLIAILVVVSIVYFAPAPDPGYDW